MLALLAGGVLLAVLGRNPFSFYGSVWTYGVAEGNWQQSAVTAVPFLLIATGLTVIFRANIWNLGYDGQFRSAPPSWRPRPLATTDLPSRWRSSSSSSWPVPPARPGR